MFALTTQVTCTKGESQNPWEQFHPCPAKSACEFGWTDTAVGCAWNAFKRVAQVLEINHSAPRARCRNLISGIPHATTIVYARLPVQHRCLLPLRSASQVLLPLKPTEITQWKEVMDYPKCKQPSCIIIHGLAKTNQQGVSVLSLQMIVTGKKTCIP